MQSHPSAMSQSSFPDSFFSQVASDDLGHRDRFEEPALLSSPFFLVAGLASLFLWWAIAAAV